jgi:hypothetical protein
VQDPDHRAPSSSKASAAARAPPASLPLERSNPLIEPNTCHPLARK